MKEMIYSSKYKREVLDTGYCLGLLYYIINLGLYPVAYIKVPENSEYFGKDMGEIDIEVHGGVTYSKNYLWTSEKDKIDGWFIGWDYAHYGDYSGYEENLPERFRINGKKWTTKEIFKDVTKVCYQIRYEETKDELEKKKITKNQARELMRLPKIENEGGKMNKEEYGEIVNGKDTYKEIANKLKIGQALIIGWTDEDSTHFDILFTYRVYKETENYLQRGLRGNELFISIIGLGSFGFDVNNPKKSPGYIGEKLNVTGDITKKKLADLINGVIEELENEII